MADPEISDGGDISPLSPLDPPLPTGIKLVSIVHEVMAMCNCRLHL